MLRDHMRVLVGGSPGTFGCHACYTGLLVISSVIPSGLTSQFLGWQVSVLPGSEASALVSVRLVTQWLKSLASSPSKRCRCLGGHEHLRLVGRSSTRPVLKHGPWSLTHARVPQ